MFGLLSFWWPAWWFCLYALLETASLSPPLCYCPAGFEDKLKYWNGCWTRCWCGEISYSVFWIVFLDPLLFDWFEVFRLKKLLLFGFTWKFCPLFEYPAPPLLIPELTYGLWLWSGPSCWCIPPLGKLVSLRYFLVPLFDNIFVNFKLNKLLFFPNFNYIITNWTILIQNRFLVIETYGLRKSLLLNIKSQF